MFEKTKRPSLITSAFSNYVALAVNVIVGLFLTPYIITELGKFGYGLLDIIRGRYVNRRTNTFYKGPFRYIEGREGNRTRTTLRNNKNRFAIRFRRI